MPVFATYLHPESFETSRPRDEISFVGQSLPCFDGVRQALVEALPGYPSVPPARCALEDFERVHDPDYLRSLRRLADGDPETAEPRRSAECSGLEFALPGYDANADFEELTGKVCRFAERQDISILSTHGGGYRRRVAVEAAVRHIGAMRNSSKR